MKQYKQYAIEQYNVRHIMFRPYHWMAIDQGWKKIENRSAANVKNLNKPIVVQLSKTKKNEDDDFYTSYFEMNNYTNPTDQNKLKLYYESLRGKYAGFIVFDRCYDNQEELVIARKIDPIHTDWPNKASSHWSIKCSVAIPPQNAIKCETAPGQRHPGVYKHKLENFKSRQRNSCLINILQKVLQLKPSKINIDNKKFNKNRNQNKNQIGYYYQNKNKNKNKNKNINNNNNDIQYMDEDDDDDEDNYEDEKDEKTENDTIDSDLSQMSETNSFIRYNSINKKPEKEYQISDEERLIRKNWKRDDPLWVYSLSLRKWFQAECIYNKTKKQLIKENAIVPEDFTDCDDNDRIINTQYAPYIDNGELRVRNYCSTVFDSRFRLNEQFIERKKLKIGDFVYVFSESNVKWFKGEITEYNPNGYKGYFRIIYFVNGTEFYRDCHRYDPLRMKLYN